MTIEKEKVRKGKKSAEFLISEPRENDENHLYQRRKYITISYRNAAAAAAAAADRQSKEQASNKTCHRQVLKTDFFLCW